jgi:hypothetical protein
MKRMIVLCRGDAGMPATGLTNEGAEQGLTAAGVEIVVYPRARARSEHPEDWDVAIPLQGTEGQGKYAWIYFFGDHGNFRVLDARDELYERPGVYGPASMNGRHYRVVRTFVETLVRNGAKARVIVLDCCWSASFIPLFRQILENNGHVIGFFCPALSTSLIGPRRIHEKRELNRAFVDAYEHELADRVEKASEDFFPAPLTMQARSAFIQVCYSMLDNIIYRDENFAPMSEGYSAADMGVEQRRTDVAALETYLRGRGLAISDVSTVEMQRRMWTIAYTGVADSF